MGSWLEGPPRDEDYVPGSDLGLPATGPGSVAGFWPRVGSLFVDWALCAIVAALAFHNAPGMNLLLFGLLNVVLLTLFGTTLGQLVFRLRVTPVSGRSPMLVRTLVRTLLLMLVLPGIIWNRNRQPVHDVAAGTAVVRV